MFLFQNRRGLIIAEDGEPVEKKRQQREMGAKGILCLRRCEEVDHISARAYRGLSYIASSNTPCVEPSGWLLMRPGLTRTALLSSPLAPFPSTFPF